MSPVRLLVFSVAALGVALLVVWSSRPELHGANATTAPDPASAPVATSPASPGHNDQLAGEPIRAIKDSKLSFHLALLADAASRAQAAGQPLTAEGAIAAYAPELRGMIAARTLRLSDSGDVQVYVLVDDTTTATVRALEDAGAHIERVAKEQRIVQAEVPPAGLRQLAALPGVRQLRPPDYPVLNAGLVTSEGDAIVNADDVRAKFGVDGSGVTIGVISDGVRGLATSQASGDLPAVDTRTCNVVATAPDAGGAEGTAMLEVVHDVAPGAYLMFGNFGFGTALDFNAAVDCLATQAHVVVDDIGFFNVGPYDGSSFVSANTANALNGPDPIRAYITAVGNSAVRHYRGNYVDSGLTIGTPPAFWDLQRFDTATTPYPTKHGGLVTGPTDLNRFRLGAASVATIDVQWNDPWGTSANDYDLFVGSGGIISLCSANVQDGVGGNSFPVEACSVQNNGTSAADVDILIGNYGGAAAPRTFDVFLVCSSCIPLSNGNLLDYNTPGSSVGNQSDAGGAPASVISVGAVRYANPNVIEPFSSQGPSEDGRLKPDIVAPARAAP